MATSAASPSARTMVDQRVEHPARGPRVEIAGRLVGQKDARPVGQRAGDGDALLLAAGKLRRAVRQPLSEPHHAQQPRGFGSAALRGLPAIVCGMTTFSSAVNSGSR